MRFVLMLQLLLLMLTPIHPIPQPYTAGATVIVNAQTSTTLEQVQDDEASYPFTWQVFLLAASELPDTCTALQEDYQQQKTFLTAYQNYHLLEYAQKKQLGWSDYFEAVRNLSVRIYGLGEAGSLAVVTAEDQIPSYFAPTRYTSSDPYPVVVMETHANGTIWGLDRKGNHVLLVNRSGLISELAEEQVLEAHQIQFGLVAGKVIFYANLYHEMKHLEQLRHNPALIETMSLDQYQQNEVEAYQVSLQIIAEALASNECL
jgi:hypothetical protein